MSDRIGLQSLAHIAEHEEFISAGGDRIIQASGLATPLGEREQAHSVRREFLDNRMRAIVTAIGDDEQVPQAARVALREAVADLPGDPHLLVERNHDERDANLPRRPINRARAQAGEHGHQQRIAGIGENDSAGAEEKQCGEHDPESSGRVSSLPRATHRPGAGSDGRDTVRDHRCSPPRRP